MLVMTCPRTPCSENFNLFFATRIVSRVVSIQKFFSNGCVRLTPIEPLVDSVEFGPMSNVRSAMLPLKSYCKPHGSVPLRLELKLSDLVVVAGVWLVKDGLKTVGDTL